MLRQGLMFCFLVVYNMTTACSQYQPSIDNSLRCSSSDENVRIAFENFSGQKVVLTVDNEIILDRKLKTDPNDTSESSGCIELDDAHGKAFHLTVNKSEYFYDGQVENDTKFIVIKYAFFDDHSIEIKNDSNLRIGHNIFEYQFNYEPVGSD